MRTIAVWIGAVVMVGGLWSASGIRQGLADEPAAPSSSSGVTGGAAGNETGGSDAAPPVIEGEQGPPAEAGQVQERTVSLTQAVHFTDAKGQDVVVGPGSYRVETEGTNRIRLLPTETGEMVMIDAVSFTHQETVERPVPVTIPDPEQPDVLHLALVSPGGMGLEAIGTYSGVKLRAVTDLTISSRATIMAPRLKQVMATAVPTRQFMPTPTVVAPVQTNPPASGGLPGEFAIRTWKGYYLTALSGGGLTADPVVITSATSAGPWEKFKIIVTSPSSPHDKSIQSGSGNYLTAVNGGGMTANVLHTDATQANDWEKFRILQLMPNYGKTSYAIQTIRGNYLTAVGNGGHYMDALHTDATQIKGWEKFRVLKCGDLGSGYTYAIQYPPTMVYATETVVSMLSTDGFYHDEFKFIRQGDGTYALQAHNGINYVTAVGGGGVVQKELPCSGNVCLQSWSDVFHFDATQVQAWEKFRFIDQGNCTYAIQTVSGFYVGTYYDSSSKSWLLTTRRSTISENEKFELFVYGLASPVVIR